MMATRTTSEEELKSVDDDPTASRLAARQELILKWFKPTAMLPFILVLLIDFGLFKGSDNWILTTLGLASVAWAGGVNIYSLYIRINFLCPRCHKRFGSGATCLSCSLPRHTAPIDSQMFESVES